MADLEERHETAPRYERSSEGLARVPRMEWKRESRCCARHRGVNPTGTLDARATANSLTIELQVSHPCGVKWINGKAVIIEPGQSIDNGWETELDGHFPAIRAAQM